MQKYRDSCILNFPGFLSFVLGFEVLVEVLDFLLFVAFKSRDTLFSRTVLILEEKTSILSKTQAFRLLLDFWGGWWGFVGLFALWFWVFDVWVFSPPVKIKSSWLSGLPQKKLEIKRKQADNLKQLLCENLHFRFCDRNTSHFSSLGKGLI